MEDSNSTVNLDARKESSESDRSPFHRIILVLVTQTVLLVFRSFCQVSAVKSSVYDPLDRLLQMFQSPCKLIEKREDKCLDYDRLMNRVQKNKDADKSKQVWVFGSRIIPSMLGSRQ